MDIKQLNYFATIVEEGTISAAAKKLHISQPPLSQQLKQLENELGVILLERGARRATLTEAGKLLYQHALNITSLMEIAIKEIEELKKGPQEILRIGLVSSASATLLDNKLETFNQRFPQTSFEIHEGGTIRLLELLQSNIIEVAIIREPFFSENIKTVSIIKEPMVAVGKSGFFNEIPNKFIDLIDIKDKPLIIYRRFEEMINSAFLEKGSKPSFFCVNDDARTSLLWASAGLGVAIMPRSAIKANSFNNMVCKTIREESLKTQLVAAYKKNTYISSIAKKFIKFLKEE